MEKVQTQPQQLEEDAAINALFRAEFSAMVRLAYTIIGNNAEAEEIVQDSFVEVYQRRADIRTPGAYLRTTVVLRCRSLLRRRFVRQSHPPEPPVGLPEFDVALWTVVHTLPEDQRVVVVLKYYGGCRGSEIAEIMGLPGSTVRSHLKRGLATLRKELES